MTPLCTPNAGLPGDLSGTSDYMQYILYLEAPQPGTLAAIQDVLLLQQHLLVRAVLALRQAVIRHFFFILHKGDTATKGCNSTTPTEDNAVYRSCGSSTSRLCINQSMLCCWETITVVLLGTGEGGARKGVAGVPPGCRGLGPLLDMFSTAGETKRKRKQCSSCFVTPPFKNHPTTAFK